MNVVADTNIFLAVALNEAHKPRIIELTENCSLYAPEILPYEIGNALLAMVKRRSIEGDDVNCIFAVTQKIPATLAPVKIEKALAIAIQHNIYAYDAFFLQCAMQLSCPMITLDGRMSDVAKAMNIELLE